MKATEAAKNSFAFNILVLDISGVYRGNSSATGGACHFKKQNSHLVRRPSRKSRKRARMFQSKITLKRSFIEIDKTKDEDGDDRERKNSWRTPMKLFNWAYSRWNIVIDLAANRRNALCDDYFDKYDDALTIDWTLYLMNPAKKKTWSGIPYGWLNPPYEKGQLDLWFEKCDKESAKGEIGIVALVPAFAGERRWKKHVWGKAQEVWAIDGRLHFGESESGREGKGANFGSMLIVWHPRRESRDAYQTIIRCDHPSFN